MKYIKQKRNQIDKCNICGKVSQLTWDHVPPKASLIENNTYADILFAEADMPKKNRYMAHYQSGIKYRTICSECNNVILGENDRVYKLFSKMIVQQLSVVVSAMQLGLVVPQYITIDTKINRVLRAICGHFLSMKPVYDEEAEADKYLRLYVLDETMKLENEKVFCWFYPHKTILNVRDIAIAGYLPNTHPAGTISVMASYPLAYMISSENEYVCNVDNLSKYSTENIDDVIPVTLHFDTSKYGGTNKLKSCLWPVNISGEEYGAMFALGNEKIMEGSRIGQTQKE